MRDERGRLVAKCEIYEERDAELRAKAARLEAEMRPTTDRMAAVQAEHDALLASSHRDKAEITKYRAQLTHFAEMEEGRSAARRARGVQGREDAPGGERAARRGGPPRRQGLAAPQDRRAARAAGRAAGRARRGGGGAARGAGGARARRGRRPRPPRARGQAGDRVEAQKDRRARCSPRRRLAGDYARQLAALSELQAAHRTADARARRHAAAARRRRRRPPRFGRARRRRRGRLGRVRRRDRLPAGSPGVYPSYSSPALFTR